MFILKEQHEKMWKYTRRLELEFAVPEIMTTGLMLAFFSDPSNNDFNLLNTTYNFPINEYLKIIDYLMKKTSKSQIQLCNAILEIRELASIHDTCIYAFQMLRNINYFKLSTYHDDRLKETSLNIRQSFPKYNDTVTNELSTHYDNFMDNFYVKHAQIIIELCKKVTINGIIEEIEKITITDNSFNNFIYKNYDDSKYFDDDKNEEIYEFKVLSNIFQFVLHKGFEAWKIAISCKILKNNDLTQGEIGKCSLYLRVSYTILQTKIFLQQIKSKQ